MDGLTTNRRVYQPNYFGPSSSPIAEGDTQGGKEALCVEDGYHGDPENVASCSGCARGEDGGRHEDPEGSPERWKGEVRHICAAWDGWTYHGLTHGSTEEHGMAYPVS